MNHDILGMVLAVLCGSLRTAGTRSWEAGACSNSGGRSTWLAKQLRCTAV